MLRGFKEKFKKPRNDDAPVDDVLEDGVLDDNEWDELDYEDEPVGSRRSRIIRSVVTGLISIIVLTIFAVGAGAAYVWYMGENSTPNDTAIAKPVEPSVQRAIKRAQRDPNASFGVSVQMLSTPVVPGSNAGITIKSVDGVTCKIVVELNKIPLVDSGLIEKPTDEYGVATWSWTTPESAPLGKWPVKVTCTSPSKKSAVVQGEMEIVKTLPED